MITAVVPVLATISALPLLGESMTAAGGVGLVCVTLGLLMGVYAQAGINRPVSENPRRVPPSFTAYR